MENSKKYLFAPGCALMVYKPHLAIKLKELAEIYFGKIDMYYTCCMDKEKVVDGVTIVTPCATCFKLYADKVSQVDTLFLLEKIAEDENFDFPDYQGISMSIQDTCAARTQPMVLSVIRKLLKRMNINLVEPLRSGLEGKCCGQTFYGKIPAAKVEVLMKKRADEMPCNDVVVYCASCIMSMAVGGKHPRYILDLLFGEPTLFIGKNIDNWNQSLIRYKQRVKNQ